MGSVTNLIFMLPLILPFLLSFLGLFELFLFRNSRAKFPLAAYGCLIEHKNKNTQKARPIHKSSAIHKTNFEWYFCRLSLLLC